MNFTLIRKENQGKTFTLHLLAWDTQRKKIEFEIRAYKSALRKPHTSQSSYDQLALMRLKDQATLLYLMRGYARGKLVHFGLGNEERHEKTMQAMLKTGWGYDLAAAVLKEVIDDDNVAPNGPGRIEADRAERVEVVSATAA